MKPLCLALVLMLTLGWGRAAPASAPPVDPARWVAQRVRSAKAGRREIVRIPLVKRGDDWGCRCPSKYIGVDAGAYEGIAWLKVSYEPGVLEGRPEHATRKDGSYRMVAEGYFTGTKETVNYGEAGRKGEDYELVGFHVLRWRPQGEDPDASLTIVLSDPQGTRRWRR